MINIYLTFFKLENPQIILFSKSACQYIYIGKLIPVYENINYKSQFQHTICYSNE